MPGNQLFESFIMSGNHPAQHEDEQVEEGEIVQPVIAQVQQSRAGSNPVRIGPEMEISFKQQHLGHEQQGQGHFQPDFFHGSHQAPPQGEQQVEPDQDHQEVNMVLGGAEEQGKQDVGRIQHIGVPVQQGIVAQIEQRGQQIRTADALHPLFQEASIMERFFQGLAVKKPVAGNEKEGRHTVTAQDVGNEHQEGRSHGVAYRHASHMDGNDPQHADAPEVVEYKVALFHKKLLYGLQEYGFRRGVTSPIGMNLSY